MKLEEIFIRFDEFTLTKFLSKAVIELLHTLDPNSIHLESLSKLILEHIPKETMLLNSKTRMAIIYSMHQSEAEEFAKFLGISDWEDVWYKLINTQFKKNMLKKALEFFETEYEEPTISIKADHEIIGPERILFPHQLRTIKKTQNILKIHPHRALLHMPTGAGKTISAMRIITTHLLENPNSLVIWLTHNEELCEQAMNEFHMTWNVAGDRKIDTYRFFGTSKLDPLISIKQGFMVAGLLKMINAAKHRVEFLAELASRVSLVVIDEAHQTIADKFSIVIEELSLHDNTQLLGLSATPGRASSEYDRMNKKLVSFFNHKKISLDTNGENPVIFLMKNGYLAKPKFNLIQHTLSNLSQKDISIIKKELDIPYSILSKLSENTARNILIIREIIRLEKKHKKIIMFASTVEHARDISLTLSAKGYNAYYITSKTPSIIRKQILDNYKNKDTSMILCNFGILTMGFDAPKTSAVVIARPTKSHVLYAQMIGRGIRGEKAGGNKACEISTITDDGIESFINISQIFEKWDSVWND